MCHYSKSIANLHRCSFSEEQCLSTFTDSVMYLWKPTFKQPFWIRMTHWLIDTLSFVALSVHARISKMSKKQTRNDGNPILSKYSPSISVMDRFIEEAVEIFLHSHRPAIISNDNFHKYWYNLVTSLFTIDVCLLYVFGLFFCVRMLDKCVPNRTGHIYSIISN